MGARGRGFLIVDDLPFLEIRPLANCLVTRRISDVDLISVLYEVHVRAANMTNMFYVRASSSYFILMMYQRALPMLMPRSIMRLYGYVFRSE